MLKARKVKPRAKQSGVKKKGPASCVKRQTETMPEALNKRFCLSEASSIACSFERCRSSFTREALTFTLLLSFALAQKKVNINQLLQ